MRTQSWSTFKCDVELVWSNCRLYNGPSALITQYANTLDKGFQLMCEQSQQRGSDSFEDHESDSDSDSNEVISGTCPVAEKTVRNFDVDGERQLSSSMNGHNTVGFATHQRTGPHEVPQSIENKTASNTANGHTRDIVFSQSQESEQRRSSSDFEKNESGSV